MNKARSTPDRVGVQCPTVGTETPEKPRRHGVPRKCPRRVSMKSPQRAGKSRNSGACFWSGVSKGDEVPWPWGAVSMTSPRRVLRKAAGPAGRPRRGLGPGRSIPVSMKSPQWSWPLWQETAFLDDTPLGVEEQKGKAGFAFLAKSSFYFLQLEIDASQEDAS